MSQGVVGPQSTKKPRYELLDYLRIIAALSVAVYHYCTNGFMSGKIPFSAPEVPVAFHYGYLGVHLFFMISGFVVIQSAMRYEPDKFAVARIVRLWPTFVICMTITAVAQLFWATPGMSTSLTKYIANLTMVPTLFGSSAIDGVYWTLYYEIVFYALVFLAIAFKFTHRLQLLLEIWVVVIAINWAFIGIKFPLLNPYCLLFIVGSFIGLAASRGWSLRLSAGFATASSLASIFGYSFVEHPDFVSPAIAGGLVFAHALLLLLCTSSRASRWRLPLSRPLGAMSYPFYLLHAHLGYMIIANLGASDTLVWLIPVVIATVLAVSYVASEVLEPLLRPHAARLANATAGAFIRAILNRSSAVFRRAGA